MGWVGGRPGGEGKEGKVVKGGREGGKWMIPTDYAKRGVS